MVLPNVHATAHWKFGIFSYQIVNLALEMKVPDKQLMQIPSSA